MKIPPSSLILLIAGLAASVPVISFASPVINGNFGTTIHQTGPTTGAIIDYSSGLNIYGEFANPSSGIEPSTYLPGTLVFGNSGPLVPGNVVSLGVTPSVELAFGPGYSAFSSGNASGSLASGIGAYSAGLYLNSANLADVNSAITVDVVGGADDGTHGSVQVDTSLYLTPLLFAGVSYNDLMHAVAGQEINVSLAAGFQPGTTNGYWLNDVLTGTVFSNAFGPFDSSFVIAAGLLEAGRTYRVAVTSQYVDATTPTDLYFTSTFVEFTVGVPDTGSTCLLFGFGLSLLIGAHRWFRR